MHDPTATGNSSSSSSSNGNQCAPIGSGRFWVIVIVVLFFSGQGMNLFFDRFRQCMGSEMEKQHHQHSIQQQQTIRQQPTRGISTTSFSLQSSSLQSAENEAGNSKASNAVVPAHSPSKERFYKARVVTNTTYDGVSARAFPSWPIDRRPLPCPEAESNWDAWPGPNTERSDDGMLFLKPYKAGSSTAVGVHLRISRNVARRQNKTLCKMRFDHNKASNVFPQRHRKKSFLWTIARDPTNRIVSFFFHFIVSRGKKEPSFASFMETIHGRKQAFDNYYLSAFSPAQWTGVGDPVQIANDIVEYYDFIAVTERMDESVVVLSMLLGIPVSDVLYLKSKGHGGYDDAGDRNPKVCTYIWPSFTTEAMENFFQTDDFQNMIRWDRAIHQAANRSLDLTIDRLGRNLVAHKLAEYARLKKIASELCVPETTFLCSKEGALNPMNDCMWTDSSCNNQCLDRIAQDEQDP